MGEDYPFNPEPDESAGSLPNGLREVYQEQYECAKHDSCDNADDGSGVHQAGSAAHGADHRDSQEHLGNRSRPHPNFLVGLEDRQVERRDHVRQYVPNHIHGPEVDTGNAASVHGRRQQRVESNGGAAQFDHHGTPSYQNNTSEAVATSDNDPAIDTFGNQAWYSERPQHSTPLPAEHPTARGLMPREVHFDTRLANQGVSPGIGPYFEWHTDFPFDYNSGWHDGNAPAPGGHLEYNEEGPWSPWSMASTAIGHSPSLTSGNLSNPMGCASGPFDQEQGQDTLAVPSNQFVGQQDSRLQCYLLQTVIQGTAGQT